MRGCASAAQDQRTLQLLLANAPCVHTLAALALRVSASFLPAARRFRVCQKALSEVCSFSGKAGQLGRDGWGGDAVALRATWQWSFRKWWELRNVLQMATRKL